MNYLSELIDKLIVQVKSAGIDIVDIFISDNHSVDGTGDYLKGVSSQYDFIKYVTQKKNIGIDRNMLFVMSMAKSKYIFPLGDDELIEDNVLSTLISQYLTKDLDLLVMNGRHVEANHKVRHHLPIHLNDAIFSNPIEAFEALWDKMPMSSFIVNAKSLEEIDDVKYLGTSHAYTGIVWDYLIQKYKSFGYVNIQCTSEPIIIFRKIPKTWRANAAKIMFHEIPLWFKKLPKEYPKKTVLEYMKSQSNILNLLTYRASGQLDQSFINSYMTDFSKQEKKKAVLIANMPLGLSKIIMIFINILRKVKRILW